jgi:hypothetical protein
MDKCFLKGKKGFFIGTIRILQLLKTTITVHLFGIMPLQFNRDWSCAIFYTSEDVRPTSSTLYFRIDENAPATSVSWHSLTCGPYRSAPSSISSQLPIFFFNPFSPMATVPAPMVLLLTGAHAIRPLGVGSGLAGGG